MVSGPTSWHAITSWQIDGEPMKIVRNFIFLGSKITVDGACMKLKDTCSLGKERYDKPR